MSFDWKATVGTVAPVLAGILGTPAAGVAVKALCGVLGLEATPENAQKAAEQVAAGSLTGDQLIALRKAEADAQLQLQKAGMDYDVQKEQLVVSDRDSARRMEMSTNAKTPYVGFWMLTLGFFGLLITMLVHPIPDANKAVLYTMLGTLGTVWVGAANFLYGGNHMDADTRAMLFQSTPTAPKTDAK